MKKSAEGIKTIKGEQLPEARAVKRLFGQTKEEEAELEKKKPKTNSIWLRREADHEHQKIRRQPRSNP